MSTAPRVVEVGTFPNDAPEESAPRRTAGRDRHLPPTQPNRPMTARSYLTLVAVAAAMLAFTLAVSDFPPAVAAVLIRGFLLGVALSAGMFTGHLIHARGVQKRQRRLDQQARLAGLGR